MEKWLDKLGCAGLDHLLRNRFRANTVADLTLLTDADVLEATAGLLLCPKRKFIRELHKIKNIFPAGLEPLLTARASIRFPTHDEEDRELCKKVVVCALRRMIVTGMCDPTTEPQQYAWHAVKAFVAAGLLVDGEGLRLMKADMLAGGAAMVASEEELCEAGRYLALINDCYKTGETA
jgi:hypothetical protein